MPYDPNLPVEGTDADAAMMRGQFAGLKDLIDAVPVVTSAQVDGVNTVPSGGLAGASASVSNGVIHFAFDIPRGADGAPGLDGQPGTPGTIIQGAVVDSVTTLDPGQAATASVFFDGALLRFSFGIPRGADGPPGPPA